MPSTPTPSPSANQLLAKAFEHHKAQLLQPAIALYQNVLDIEPNNFDAVHMLGTAYAQLNQLPEALLHLTQAANLRPDNQSCLDNLGKAQVNAKQFESAINTYEQLLQAGTANWSHYFQLGCAYLACKKPDSAKLYLTKVVEANRNHHQAWFKLAQAQQQVQYIAEALSSYKKAMELAPETFAYCANYALLLQQQGQTLEALTAVDKALTLQPNQLSLQLAKLTLLSDKADYSAVVAAASSITAAGNSLSEPAIAALALAQTKLTQYSEAMDTLNNAIANYPLEMNFQFLRAELFCKLDDQTSAMSDYRRVLALQPNHFMALLRSGCALLRLHHYKSAISHFEQCIKLQPDSADAWANKASALIQSKDNIGAKRCFEKAMAVQPANLELIWNYSLVLLRLGQFEQGWKHYESRMHPNKANPVGRRPNFNSKTWNGEAIEDQHLMIWHEQGIGDELMFGAFVQDLVGKAKRITLSCDKRLQPLLQRSHPEIEVVAADPSYDYKTLSSLPDVDIALASLPRLAKVGVEPITHSAQYLVPKPNLVTKWQKRYAKLQQPLTVGIAWRAGAKQDPWYRQVRSVSLEALRHLAGLPVNFVNLQYDSNAKETIAIEKNFGLSMHCWSDADPMNNLEDFSAQVAALDLVVSVDNSTVHFAGALGVPCWMLTPYVSDWRWPEDENKSLWYPDTQTTYRQPKQGDWKTVLHRVRRDLAIHVSR